MSHYLTVDDLTEYERPVTGPLKLGLCNLWFVKESVSCDSICFVSQFYCYRESPRVTSYFPRTCVLWRPVDGKCFVDGYSIVHAKELRGRYVRDVALEVACVMFVCMSNLLAELPQHCQSFALCLSFTSPTKRLALCLPAANVACVPTFRDIERSVAVGNPSFASLLQGFGACVQVALLFLLIASYSSYERNYRGAMDFIGLAASCLSHLGLFAASKIEFVLL